MASIHVLHGRGISKYDLRQIEAILYFRAYKNEFIARNTLTNKGWKKMAEKKKLSSRPLLNICVLTKM